MATITLYEGIEKYWVDCGVLRSRNRHWRVEYIRGLDYSNGRRERYEHVRLYRRGQIGKDFFWVSRTNGKIDDEALHKRVMALDDRVLNAFKRLPKRVKKALGI